MLQHQAHPVRMDPTWYDALASELAAPYMRELMQYLASESKNGKVIYPGGSDYFQALNLTPLPKVKVVILGQDPYHGPGQAHGLCFSVQPGVPPPPSLVNIYKELNADLGVPPPEPLHGCLESWARQGVLMLNCVLTVEHGLPGSHAGRGWELFTDRVIALLNEHTDGTVFVLWGAYAQKKGKHIDRKRHLVLTSAHPSPLSAYRGFFGNRPFSRINAYLASLGKAPIAWELPPIKTPIKKAPKRPRQS